ncbi:aldo/keto reductase [Nonomuraea sp. NPDC050328]|uniref:aldo/keto reductase n=1 Tax=Nonomuraea sp. NPDC050328 TaxID=3364361 RepID=UPI0037894E91
MLRNPRSRARLTARTAAFDLGQVRPRQPALDVLRLAVDHGVNHIDTAAFYFSPLRSANELINRALAPYPDDLVIATKVGPGRDPAGDWWWATPEQLRGQVEENIRQLGTDHLDLVNLRAANTRDSISELFGALADLRQEGLIRELGVSQVSPAQLAEAEAIAPVVCVQNSFGVDAPERQREFVRACGERGIAFVPFFAMAGAGREQGPGTEQNDAVTKLAAARGVSPAQIRLAWTLHQGPNVLAIPGTGNPAHLLENLAAADLRLTQDELALL